MVSNVENLPQYFQTISDKSLLFRVVLRISEPLALVCWGIHRLKTKMLNYGDHERFYFNEVARSKFEVLINDAYENTIQRERNTFILLIDFSGKECIDESTYVFNLWVNKTPHESRTIKAVHGILALLFHKGVNLQNQKNI